jgi:hypothetical protein
MVRRMVMRSKMEMRSKLGQIVSSVWWRKCNLRRKIKSRGSCAIRSGGVQAGRCEKMSRWVQAG